MLNYDNVASAHLEAGAHVTDMCVSPAKIRSRINHNLCSTLSQSSPKAKCLCLCSSVVKNVSVNATTIIIFFFFTPD